MKSHMPWHSPVRIAESLLPVMDPALDEILQHATNEALALAWTTPYPWFVLPVLLEEKLAAARRYYERQRIVRCRSLEILRKMGWRYAVATGEKSAEADLMPPIERRGRYSSAGSVPVMACVG